MVAAGAPHALVKVLRSDMHEAKADAAGTLANIASQEQHVGAVVAAGAIEACVAVLQTGPDDAKDECCSDSGKYFTPRAACGCSGGSRCSRGLHCSAAIWT